MTLTGGTGTLATATITVAGGAVTQVVIVNPGIDYLIGDSLRRTRLTSAMWWGFRFSSPRYRARRPTAASPLSSTQRGHSSARRELDFADTFMAFNNPGTNAWIVSNPNSITFNALQTANKDSSPDPIVTLAFNLRQAWLIGTKGNRSLVSGRVDSVPVSGMAEHIRALRMRRAV